MKRIAIGCLVIILLGGAVAVGIGFYLYRKAQATLAEFRQFDQVPDLERQVRVQGSYTPPSSGELTAQQLDRLVRVQTHVKERLGQRFAEMERRYKALSGKKEATFSDLPELLSAYRDLAAAWMDAKRSQVEALNEAGLSLEEYRWIRDQAYQALGVPFVDFDIAKFAEQIKSGSPNIQPGQIRGAIGESGPEANRKLIEKYKKVLEDNVSLASFGL
jgi:hypothetical protein